MAAVTSADPTAFRSRHGNTQPGTDRTAHGNLGEGAESANDIAPGGV